MRSRGAGGAASARSVALLNQGIGGNRVLRDGLGPAILARFHRDVLAVSGVRWLVVFAGVNDIGTADATLAAQTQVVVELGAAYEQIAAKAHAAGIAFYAATLTPFGGSVSYDDPGGHREYAPGSSTPGSGPGGDATAPSSTSKRPSSTSARLIATRWRPDDCGRSSTPATACT